MKTETYTLPACWASALINNDYSGLDEAEIYELEYETRALGSCLDCSEEVEITRYKGLITECLQYTFVVRE